MGDRKSSVVNSVLFKILNCVWKIPIGLSILLLIVVIVGAMGPMLFAFLWVFIIGVSLFGSVKKLEHSRPALLFYALMSIFVFLGFLAPFRVVCLYIAQYYPPFTKVANFWIAWIQDYTDLNYIAHLDFYTGLVAAACVFVMFAQDILWRLVQIRQVKTLPMSTTRAAAQGMVKIEGVCEPVQRSNGPIIIDACCYSEEDNNRFVVRKQPFYIRDKHGKVLIDPKNAEVIGGDTSFETGNNALLDLRACEIILTEKAPMKRDILYGYQLMEGDKVTVYGTARANKHYGTDDLGNEAEIIIEAAKSDLSKFKFHDVFLVITGKSVDAANAVGRRIKSGIISMIILIGLCVSLVYLGYQGMQDFDSIYHSKHLIGMYDDMQ